METGEKRNAYIILVGKPEEKRQITRLRQRREEANSSELRTEASGSTKCREFLH
jgi:hypothetical protein